MCLAEGTPLHVINKLRVLIEISPLFQLEQERGESVLID